MTKLQITALALITGFTLQSRATLFDISFDIQGNSGSGVITASPNGDGTFLVTDGSVLVTTGSWASATPYILAPNNFNFGTFNSYGQSSEGHFSGGADMIYDNILYPGNTPYLDGDGLGFWTASGTAGLGFNVWGNSGASDYTFYGLGQLGNPYVTGGTVSLSVVPVPEASTVIAGALLLLPFGANALRSLRRNRAA